jgi:uncharacterized protein (TIGR00369 family)
MPYPAQDPDFDARVRASFARQQVMATLGAAIHQVAPGEVTLSLPFRADLTQQAGSLHAGVITAIVDSACGYAALSLMAVGLDVVSVEFKVNLMAPALGERFLATGRVLRPGRTLTVCLGEVVALQGTEQKVVATMLGTMMGVPFRPAGS